MPVFRYSALDPLGQTHTGEIQAADLREATNRLRDSGYFPTELVPVEEKPVEIILQRGRRRRIGRQELTIFTRQLSDLIGAGMPLDRCLTVLIEQSDNPAFQELLGQVQAEIRGGSPLSTALAQFPRIFPEMYTNMLRAGEASGQLPEVLARLADFLEREAVRRSQVISALTYPAVLLGVAVLAVTFLLTFVIPRLSQVFEDLGGALPLPTQILLAVTGFIGYYWWLIALALASGYFFLRFYARTETGARQLDALFLRLPIAGPIITKIVISRFARSFGTMLAGGVPLLEALEIAGTASGNRVVLSAVRELIESARRGEALNVGMRQTGRFPPVLVHMTAVGEETGDLPRMLSRVSDSMDFEVDATLRRLTSMLEPAIVLTVGGFVGFVVLSILLPIFQANTLVR